jgi:phage terminase large subunit-like protein
MTTKTKKPSRRKQNSTRKAASPIERAVEGYIEGVLNGKIIAGELTRLAVKRHLLDLENGKARGLYFDKAKAERAIEFFGYLKHSKGEWAGQFVKLEPWQMFIKWVVFGWMRKDGTRRFRNVYLEVARKNGKALEVHTIVATPAGWKQHGELIPGDYVFGPDGLPKRVLSVSGHYVGPCHTLRFSDGAEIIGHASHEWQTNRTAYTGRPSGSRKPLPLVETAFIAKTIRHSTRKDLTHSISVTKPLQLPVSHLPIPPYTLGAWLGDGHSAGSRLTCADSHIVERIEREGVAVKRYDGIMFGLGCGSHGGSKESRMSGLTTRLKKLGVLNNKHIPLRYLRSSDAQRRDLLSGLMDTDGHVTKRGQCEIVLTRKQLFDSVVELLTTLGYKPTCKTDTARINGRAIGPRYRVQFWAKPDDRVVSLPRKANRLKATWGARPRSSSRMIVSAEPCGHREVNCIEVEGGFYLAGRALIATHNSTDAAGTGLYLAFADDEPGAEVYSTAPLALDTPIPTPTGWTTMGSLKIGDTVFDEQGALTAVTYVSPVMHGRPCYAVNFFGGERIISDAEHRWATRSTTAPSLKGRSRDEWMHHPKAVRRGVQVRTTLEIAETLKTAWGSTNHSIELADALQLPEKLLPISPYVLGVWLGDGRANRGAIVMHANDRQIADEIESEGYRLSSQKSHDGLLHYTIMRLRPQLRRLGLIDSKTIPTEYLRASPSQRLGLLQGLMDTDGTCTKTGECRFTNRILSIAEGVKELAISLGLFAHLRAVVVTGSPHYVVSFRAPQDKPVFRLKRKLDRQCVRCTPRARRRFITAVDRVESVPVRCISVDSPSHLYLVGRGMIPTHNTKKDQAIIVHSEATRMVHANPEFKRLGIETYKHNICRPERAQKYEPLGADEDTLDGYNVHASIVDELHAHKTRGVYDLMDTGTSARRQPILWAITTAGTDQTEASVCWEQHVYTEQILRGFVEDDSHFGMIFCLDTSDDWTEEKNWYKANPNLGVSKKLDYMREQAVKAKALPSKQNTFKRLDLNEWTQQATRWIDMGLWDANAGPSIDEAELVGRPCYGGIDLSSVSDITAWLLLFPDPVVTDRVTVLVRLWCPEARLQRVEVEESGNSKSRRRNLYAEQYQAWAREGLLLVTPGNAIDYAQIEAQVAEDAQRFHVQEIAVDRLFQGYQFSMNLQEHHGLTVAACGMGYMSMAGPCAEFERRLLEKKIHHGGHPVLRWMANNVAVREDPAGNKKPDKSTSQGKIDGIVALLLGLDRVMRQQNTASVYETRGMLTVGG